MSISESIDKDARDNLDRTPLHYACIEGHNDVVQLLTDHLALDSCIDAHGYALQSPSNVFHPSVPPSPAGQHSIMQYRWAPSVAPNYCAVPFIPLMSLIARDLLR